MDFGRADCQPKSEEHGIQMNRGGTVVENTRAMKKEEIGDVPNARLLSQEGGSDENGN